MQDEPKSALVGYKMGNKHPTICLLGASFNTNNMGVNALTAGTTKAIFYQFPNAELFLLDYGKERRPNTVEMSGRRIVVQHENIRFSKRVYLRNHIAMLLFLSLMARVMPLGRMKWKLVSQFPALKRLSEADIVTSLAGGDSFSDIYGLRRFFYVAFPQLLALLMQKRLIFLPQTIGPFEGTIARNVARFIMKRAEIIYSRDREGLQVARNLLSLGSEMGGKIRFCFDVAFVLDPVRPKNMNVQSGDQEEKGRPLVGLNISGLLYIGGYSGRNLFGLKLDYRDLISDLIDFMIMKKDASVMLVPHVFGTDEESDFMVCQEVYSSLKERYNRRLLFASGDYNESEVKYIISLCDFFIGSRMHACIAALSQNVPTVSIAYSRKFLGVMETIGVEDLVADPRKLEKEEMFKVIGDAFENKARLRGHLEKTVPRVKETVLNLFNEIGSLRRGV